MWHQAVQTALAMQAQVVLAREAKAVNAKATLLQAAAVHRVQAPNMFVLRAALRVPLLRALTAAALPAAIIETTAQAAHITEATRQMAATIAAVHLQEVPRQAQAAALAATVVAAAQVQAQV